VPTLIEQSRAFMLVGGILGLEIHAAISCGLSDSSQSGEIPPRISRRITMNRVRGAIASLRGAHRPDRQGQSGALMHLYLTLNRLRSDPLRQLNALLEDVSHSL
jgi:hypothetical protein